MVTVEQMTQCPNCLSKDSLFSENWDYGYLSKILGSAIKRTDDLRCDNCHTLVTEIWVLAKRNFKIPTPPNDEGEKINLKEAA